VKLQTFYRQSEGFRLDGRQRWVAHS
jgi:hypothetical protein